MILSQGRSALRAALLFCLLASAQSDDELALKSRQANALMGQGRFADAVPLYEQLVKALPGNPGLRLNLGLALHMAGRDRDAVPHLEAVLKAQPSSLPALLHLGLARVQLGQPALAVAPLSKAVSLDPSNLEPRGLLANALLAAGRAAEAAPHFRRLTALTPRDPRAWSGLGRCYETLASQAFEQLDRTARGSAEWSVLVADSRFARRQYRAAFYFYRQALQAKPDFRGVHAALARVYEAAGRADWAAVEAEREKALPAPDCAASKAECDFNAGRFLEASSSRSPYWRAKAFNELAIRAFSTLGSLPPSVDLHALKADIAANRGRHAEAAEEWRAALKLAPGDPRLTRELTISLFLARDYERVMPMLREQLAQTPGDADLNFFMGDSLLRTGKPGDAIAFLEKAVRSNPKLLPARASLGQALSAAGRAPEAIPHLEAGLALDEDGSIHYQLSRAYQSGGQPEKARQMLAKYQEIRRTLEAEAQDLEEKVKISEP